MTIACAFLWYISRVPYLKGDLAIGTNDDVVLDSGADSGGIVWIELAGHQAPSFSPSWYIRSNKL